jgi:hypothetical protein
MMEMIQRNMSKMQWRFCQSKLFHTPMRRRTGLADCVRGHTPEQQTMGMAMLLSNLFASSAASLSRPAMDRHL